MKLVTAQEIRTAMVGDGVVKFAVHGCCAPGGSDGDPDSDFDCWYVIRQTICAIEDVGVLIGARVFLTCAACGLADGLEVTWEQIAERINGSELNRRIWERENR